MRNSTLKNYIQLIPIQNLTAITEERFEQFFKPEPNPIEHSEVTNTIHRAFLDPYDPAQKKIITHFRDVYPRQIWTLMEIQDQDVLVSGYIHAKREGFRSLGYLLSKTSVNVGTEFAVPMTKKFI
ncbi:hypothetical protein [Undibacterium oligocarboniphilum]|uniref:Uncharacterized protein n=1 Tax=Undibacterium oligocarboniphilum TaxID=666702 RepID=A0A850QNY9_9BURK|nr:hypothetical protein [Undibacterium oligocarboniphilum]MBC3871749.1 hypothetical protein [Undibacterium oligocarboniphilum]NVO79385.1 hypothetical protein [Undibacterium oligocarboniphilum]